MRSVAGLVSVVSGLVGLVLLTIGVVYLVVACENLPGILGPVAGDSSPRTPLGAIVLTLGVLALGLAAFTGLRRRSG